MRKHVNSMGVFVMVALCWLLISALDSLLDMSSYPQG